MAVGAHAAGDFEGLADGADIGLILPGHIGLMVVGVLLGILVEVLPGALRGVLLTFLSTEIESMIAPETADHAAGTSALLPILTLSIPGSATAAVMLGGLMIWGLHPGPTLFVEQHDFVWGLIASMYLDNVASLIVVLVTVPLFASILRIPFSIIAPIIMVCAMGAYSVHNAFFDVVLMLFWPLLSADLQRLLQRRAES